MKKFRVNLKLKSENGGITLFVVVSMLFTLIMLILSYARVTNKNTAQNKQIELIQENYKVSNEKIMETYKKSYNEYTEDTIYTVTYLKNSEEATGEMETETARFNEDFSPAENTFVRAGYTFTEWNTSADGTGTVWKVGETKKYEAAVDTTLYAQWTENKYTIAFDKNGGTGSMSSLIDVRYTESKTLTTNTFTKKNNTFKGWATTKANANAGTVEYGDGAVVSKLSATNGQIVTLYAVWSKK